MSSSPVDRRLILATLLIVLVYLALGLTNVTLRSPWCDEAWFASPAVNLAYHGFMGTTVLDPASSTWKSVKLNGIDRHTYWVMPLNLLLNAAAFRLFGFSIYPMRLISLVWGLAALAAWGAILWKLTARPWLALGGTALAAIDYHFVLQASDGRMDVMTVALGWSGVAAYLLLRERSLPLAIAVSHTLAAAALFTHPNGIVLVAILLITVLYFDRLRLRVLFLPLAALPYLAIGGGWALYILRAPADFAAQFLGNAGGRGPTITTPLAALSLEITHRYMDSYGLAGWASLAGRLNAIPLAIFVAALCACLAIPAIRRQPPYRLLLLWTLAVLFYLTEGEGLKTHFYLIYLTPLYSFLVAISAAWSWQRAPRLRIPLAALLVVFVMLQAARTPISVRRNSRGATFDPAVRFLASRFTPRTFIMGNACLMFGLGADSNLLDDFRLGYNTGKRADVVVIDPSWDDRIEMLRSLHPPIYAFVTGLLKNEYQEVYNHGGYRILVRHPLGTIGG